MSLFVYKFLNICFGFWIERSRFEHLPESLRCVLGQDTLLKITVPLFIQEYKWVQVHC